MENPMVKCSVANCEYWEEGNQCVADSILIEVGMSTAKKGSADDPAFHEEASAAAETFCRTFEEKPH